MEKTNYHRDISTGLCSPKLHTYNMKNSFTCMYDGEKNLDFYSKGN